MEHPNNWKGSLRKRSSESLRSSSSSTTTTRYNLRSRGPPSYEQFADSECPICLEEYDSSVIVNCGHSFCSPCIKKCIGVGSSKTCPVCKKSLVQALFISSKDFTNRIMTKRFPNRSSTMNVQESDKKEKISQNAKKRPVKAGEEVKHELPDSYVGL